MQNSFQLRCQSLYSTRHEGSGFAVVSSTVKWWEWVQCNQMAHSAINICFKHNYDSSGELRKFGENLASNQIKCSPGPIVERFVISLWIFLFFWNFKSQIVKHIKYKILISEMTAMSDGWGIQSLIFQKVKNLRAANAKFLRFPYKKNLKNNLVKVSPFARLHSSFFHFR